MVSDTVARLVVRLVDGRDREPFGYLPGQFVRLDLGNGVSRDFSMADLPGENRPLEFFIRVYPDGKFSGHIGSHAYPGEELKELQKRLPALSVYSTVVHPDPAWTGEVGLVTDVAERVLEQPGRFEYYCGPPAMIGATTRLLERLGVPREQMHHEDFVPSERENDGSAGHRPTTTSGPRCC